MEPVFDTDYSEEYTVEDLSDLETISHMYGLVKAEHDSRVEEQLEQVYDQLQEYRSAKTPGSRQNAFEEGMDLWVEMAEYWDLTGKYDREGIAAITPIFATQSLGIGIGAEESEDIEDLRERLDGGIDGF